MPSVKSTKSRKSGAPKLKPFRQDGQWWLDATDFTPDRPTWGPYTKAEAIEERRSFWRNGLYQGNGSCLSY